ncbi:hypothetical protein C4N9_08770 [Pararhodobacter marinus]|uniref:Uncharacterized protein n=1 Tax=Pararhodobacter marinus TaxID=2184063 RepID=A0A2U2CAI9_9RHOB|nr:hypothetical protein [Pararhodobacter marinus]PWE28905.1 hypothetical protein C4N9_08770 [Pararhodobacter marinus]
MTFELTIETAEQIAATALAEAKAAARATLNAWMTEARRAAITDLPGQDLIYQAKEAEARAYVADPSPDLADYPLLSAEIGITAPDAAALASLWISLSADWRATAATLEALRMTTGAAIDTATTKTEIAAALAALPGAGT